MFLTLSMRVLPFIILYLRTALEKASFYYDDKILLKTFLMWKGHFESYKIEQARMYKRMNSLAISYYRFVAFILYSV